MTATVAAADRLYLEEKEMSKNNCSPFSEDEGHSPYRSRPLKKRRLQKNRREDETSEKAPSCGHNDDNERDLVNDHDASYFTRNYTKINIFFALLQRYPADIEAHFSGLADLQN